MGRRILWMVPNMWPTYFLLDVASKVFWKWGLELLRLFLYFSICFSDKLHQMELDNFPHRRKSRHLGRFSRFLDSIRHIYYVIFCCVVACNFFGCQQDFLAVWRWNQLRTVSGVLENNFTDYLKAVSSSRKYLKILKNIYTLKFSQLIPF